MKATIGQQILAAVLAHQLGISTERAFKRYVHGRELDPSWQEAGEALLRSSREIAGAPLNPRLILSGPQLVRDIKKGDAS